MGLAGLLSQMEEQELAKPATEKPGVGVCQVLMGTVEQESLGPATCSQEQQSAELPSDHYENNEQDYSGLSMGNMRDKQSKVCVVLSRGVFGAPSNIIAEALGSRISSALC